MSALDVRALNDQGNAQAFDRLVAADPVLVDVSRTGDVVPGMTPATILTSGAPLAWDDYYGGQRNAVLGAALYEGLARTREEADAKIRAGEIVVGACHDHACIGSLAGIYTASMPVFVVENKTFGNSAFCNFYEGESRKRLNYGVYDEDVRRGLKFIEEVVARVVGQAVRAAPGGVRLRPLIRRALHMGDELHSRNTAATLLFTRELFPHFINVAGDLPDEVRRTLAFLKESDYFFLRLSMSAGKATADPAHGIEGSTVVTAMSFSCRELSIRVSGLGDHWWRGPLPDVEAKLFDGYTKDDVAWMGGESSINETVGLGGCAQAAAFPLQAYQGGSPDEMIRMNLEMYEITVGEHPEFKIPYFSYRGVPTGIDVNRVVATGITPVIDAGVAGKDGGQIGAGVVRPPIDCFMAASKEYTRRYG
jgi:Protein of unknown function (DUF1116)